MIQINEEDLRQFTETWKDMQEALKHVRSNHNNRATVHVEAGGVGIWIAATCCFVMVAMMVIGALWASREFSRADQQTIEMRAQNDKMQDYLNAIYMQAPHLKPKDAK